jgi:hypothetical protein
LHAGPYGTVKHDDILKDFQTIINKKMTKKVIFEQKINGFFINILRPRNVYIVVRKKMILWENFGFIERFRVCKNEFCTPYALTVRLKNSIHETYADLNNDCRGTDAVFLHESKARYSGD